MSVILEVCEIIKKGIKLLAVFGVLDNLRLVFNIAA